MPIKRELTVNKPQLKALYERIGGENQLGAILKDFYHRMAQDIWIGFFFTGKDLDLIASQQKAFLMKAMGATTSYQGKPPAKAHLELPPILVGHFDRRLRILEDTLKDHGLSQSEIETWISFENTFRKSIVQQ